MSQAKVDRYKEEKKNRAKIIKKQKREWAATKVGLSAVALALVVWAGVSIYNVFQADDAANAQNPVYTVDTSSLDEFLFGLGSEE